LQTVNVLKSQKIHLKTLILGVQGPLRPSMLVPRESLSAVLVISIKSVSICNLSHVRRANSGKIMIS